MAAVMAGAAIVGAGVSAYGAIKGAEDQAALERQRQAIALQQANELDDRQSANDALRETETYRAKLDFGAAAAGSGHTGTGVGSQLEIQRQSDLQKILSDRDEAFQSMMLRKGAHMSGDLANNIEQAGYISAAGSLLGSAGQAGGLMASGAGTGPSQSQSLPARPRGY